ncbi:MAG TPA: SGNH/GDSL hydrolase family protein [Xanthobacteraceae bacterium]|nr:SGNH/GDSL hydrolase family protein [Xanthobacteraceae bacterium]
MNRWTSAAANAATVIVSVVLTFAAMEGALRLYAGFRNAAPGAPATGTAQGRWARAESRQWLLTLPEEWQRRDVEVPGARHAFYWHGALHVLNDDNLRWSRPFPPKRDDTYRVMVVGDSFTYGQGIAEEDRFSNLVEQWLGADFRIELINIGHPSYQSADILAEIKHYLPVLRPNLVLYAVCLNDFLPSGVRPYPDHLSHPFPLPEAFENWMIAHTRVGALVNDLYDATLRRFHLRNDFYDDILADFAGYQRRFAGDVAQMNEVVRAANLSPLVAMVIDQLPLYQGRGYQIARIAENDFAKAGAEVIRSEPFYRTYSGRDFSVSRWEGHPNEEANWLWAEMIADALRQRADLKSFAKTRVATSPP